MLKLEDFKRDVLVFDLSDAVGNTVKMHISIERGWDDLAGLFARYAFQDWKRVLHILGLEK